MLISPSSQLTIYTRRARESCEVSAHFHTICVLSPDTSRLILPPDPDRRHRRFRSTTEHAGGRRKKKVANHACEDPYSREEALGVDQTFFF